MLPKKTRGGTVVREDRAAIRRREVAVRQEAVGAVAGALLMRGTKNKSRQQIQDEIDRLKAQDQCQRRRHGASATIETTEAIWPEPCGW